MVLTVEPAGPLKRCYKCGESKPLAEFHRERRRPDGLQSKCRSCSGAYAKRRYADNKEVLIERRLQYRAGHADRQREHARAYNADLKAKVFEHYGTTCACCGSADDLTVDHINGDGRQHREEVFGDAETGGAEMYRWLIANGFPGGLQALCRACNLSKGTGPRCTLSHLAEEEARALVRKLLSDGVPERQIRKLSGVSLALVRRMRKEEL